MAHYIEDRSHHFILGNFAKTFIRQTIKSIELNTCTKFKKSDDSSSKSAVVFSHAGEGYM